MPAGKGLGAVDLINAMVAKIGVAFTILVVNSLQVFEASMREPLQHMGVPGWGQVLLILLIPISSIVVVIRWARGFMRFVLLGVFGIMAVHAALPLIPMVSGAVHSVYTYETA